MTVYEQAVTVCRNIAYGEFDGRRAILASVLSSLGIILQEVGRGSEGVLAAEEAVELYRSSDLMGFPLAAALTSLSVAYQALARNSEALDAVSEAVDAYRQLESVDGDNFAIALTMLGRLLHEFGRGSEALEIAREAVAQYRALDLDAYPVKFRISLLGALSLLESVLENLGQQSEQLAVTQEIVDVYRLLADSDQAIFERIRPCASPARHTAGPGGSQDGSTEPHSGGRTDTPTADRRRGRRVRGRSRPGSDQHGLYLSHSGDTETALQVADVSVSVFRLLAAHDDVHKENLAYALNNLGAYLAETGNENQALPLVREALTLFRRQRDGTSNTNLEAEAACLANLAQRLHFAGELKEELAIREQLTSDYRQLVDADPSHHVDGLAAALTELAQLRAKFRQWVEAAKIGAELVDLRRRWSSGTLELAIALLSYGGYLAETDHRREASSFVAEAVSIFRATGSQNHDAFDAPFDVGLKVLMTLHAEQGDWPQVLSCAEQLADLRRNQAKPEIIDSQLRLVEALDTMGAVLSILDRGDEAIGVAAEALSIYRQLAAIEPGTYEPKLAVTLYSFSIRLADAGSPLDALLLVEEAVEILQRFPQSLFAAQIAQAFTTIDRLLLQLKWLLEAYRPAGSAVEAYRDLASGDPERFIPDLAESLVNYGLRLSYVSRFDEAIATADEGTALLANLSQDDPESHAPHYGRALYASAWIRLNANQDRQTAIEHAVTCLEIARALHDREPSAYAEFLATAEQLYADLVTSH